MFRFRQKETWPLAVQLYGKHPVAKDYLRVGCGQDGGRGLREWMDAAFSASAERDGGRAFAQPMRFVLRDSWGAPLVGSLWPSSDAGGERPFPLALFVERRSAAVREDFDQHLDRMGGMWRLFDELRAGLDHADSGQALLQSVRGRTIAQADVIAVEEDPLEAQDWLSALWPEGGREGLFAALDRVAAWKRASYSGPLRVPFVTRAPLRAQAQAWAMLLAAALERRAGEVPSLAFPARDARGPLFGVWFQQAPAAADGRWLRAGGALDESTPGELWDGAERALARERPATEGTPRLVDSLRAVAASWRARAR